MKYFENLEELYNQINEAEYEEVYQHVFTNESNLKVYMTKSGSLLPNKFACWD